LSRRAIRERPFMNLYRACIPYLHAEQVRDFLLKRIVCSRRLEN